MQQPDLNELGDRVKKIRRELNISQKDFANKISISSSFLSEIESGKVKPGFDFFYNISMACNVNPWFILFGEGDIFRQPKGTVSMELKDPENQIEGVEDIFWYMSRSPMFRSTVTGFAAKYLLENETLINKDMERFKKKKDGKQ